jgi:hypothetical protein
MDPSISNAVLGELRSINDDIVQLANQVWKSMNKATGGSI